MYVLCTGDSEYSLEEGARDLLESVSDIHSVAERFVEVHPSPIEVYLGYSTCHIFHCTV